MTGLRGAWARAAVVMAVVLVVDQVSKVLVRHNVEPGERSTIVGPLKLVHVRNDGVAFGTFAGGGALVIVVVVVALVALVAYFTTHASTPLVWLPTGMLLGGALGNIIDRIDRGSVTDFIKPPHWPAFNAADIAITLGVLVLLWVIERDAPHRRPG